MRLVGIAGQLGTIGSFPQLMRSPACALGNIPDLLRVLRQDVGCLA
jgi:hypothetical protein